MKKNRADTELFETRKYIDGVTDSAPVLLAYIDKSQCCQFVNRIYEEWFDRDRSSFLSRNVRDLFIGGDNQALNTEIDRVLSVNSNPFS